MLAVEQYDIEYTYRQEKGEKLLKFLALFSLRRADRKDAVSKIIIIYDIYRSFLEFYLPIQFCLQL